MKNKLITILTLTFFVIVNTTYYWEGKLGLLAFPTFILLAITYFGLLFVLIKQLLISTKEKFKNKSRFLPIGLLTVILIITFFNPLGVINFDKFEGENLLTARREGAANCITTFYLKDNNTFKERNVCFGVSEITGTYRLSNDTIYFDNVNLRKQPGTIYKFGFIEELEIYTENKYVLRLFKNKKDTVGFNYFIGSNKLNIKPKIKPNS